MGKLLAPPVIAGCGQADTEKIQLVAVHTSKAFCYALDRLKAGRSEGGPCKDNERAWKQNCKVVCFDAILPADVSASGVAQASVAFGHASSDAAGLGIELKGGRDTVVSSLALGKIQGALGRKLDEHRSVFIFGALLPACLQPERVKVNAFDASGEIIGSDGGIGKSAGCDVFQ